MTVTGGSSAVFRTLPAGIGLVLGLWLAVLEPAAAAPSGADLLAACERAVADGFHGITGSMCRWYITPCDCTPARSDLPRVCLPESVPEERLAREVSTELRARPDLQRQPAAEAAQRILARRYPCP